MRAFALAVALASSLAAPAFAAESAYSTHDWDKCRKIAAEDDTVTRKCAGPNGHVLLYTAGEDAASVGIGEKGMTGDWPNGFIFPKNTVEWRSAGGKPYAAILRYDVGPAIGGPFKSQLFVYRLEAMKSSCLVATVDGTRKDANERARAVADERAPKFTCEKDAFTRE